MPSWGLPQHPNSRGMDSAPGGGGGYEVSVPAAWCFMPSGVQQRSPQSSQAPPSTPKSSPPPLYLFPFCFAAFLRRSPQESGPGDLPAALHPGGGQDGLAVWVQAHPLPPVLRRHPQRRGRAGSPALRAALTRLRPTGMEATEPTGARDHGDVESSLGFGRRCSAPTPINLNY